MMVIEATVISSSGLNVIVTLAGMILGMGAAVIAIRERFVGHRAVWLEHELTESLGQLERRPTEKAAIEDAIDRQEIALQRVRRYALRRQYFYRLLLGYLALISLAFLFVWLLFENNSGLQSASLRWFWIGLAAAAAVGAISYLLASSRRLQLHSALFEIEPVRIPSELGLAPAREVDLELFARKWLAECGYKVVLAPARSGFDLLAERGEKKLVVEIKAVPRLTIEDVDALAGAAARLSWGDAEDVERPTVALMAPPEALGNSPSALSAADVLGIEVYAIDDQGKVSPLGGGSSVESHWSV